MGPIFAFYLKKMIRYFLKESSPSSTTFTFPSWSHHSCKKVKRRKPGLPYHFTLESYNPDLEVGGEELEGEMVSFFGPSCLDPLRCNHPDDQFATKVLATYMSHPYRNALAAIKHEFS